MRPVTLTIEGLRSFREEQEISFDGRDYIAIIGDTGAGKSSILEAMSYALYGRLTYTGTGNQQIMNDVSSRLRVILVFDASGDRWRVTRVLRRDKSGVVGSPSVSLERLDPDGVAVETYEGRSPVDARIEAIVGLDHDAFTTTVVLPQGKFARLLLAEDKIDRRAVLKQIWPTDHLEAVGELADGHVDRLNVLKGQLGARAQGPAGSRDELATAAKEAEAHHANVTAIDSEAAAPLETLDRLTGEVRQLQPAVDRIMRWNAADLLQIAEGVTEERNRVTAARDQAEAEIAELEAERRAVPDDEDGLAADEVERQIATLRQATATHAQLAEAVADLEAELMRLGPEITAAQEDTDRLAVVLAEAEAALTAAQRADAAAHAAEGHAPGDPCPVCDRPLPDDWSAPAAAAIDEASEQLQAARQAHEKAASSKARLAADEGATTRELESKQGALEEATRALAELGSPSEAELEARRDELRQRAAVRRDLEEKLKQALNRRNAAEVALAGVGSGAVDTLQTETAGHVAGMSAVAELLSEPPPQWTLDRDHLPESIRALDGLITDLVGRASARLAAMKDEGAAAKATVQGLLERAGLEPPESSADARPALARAVAAAEHRLADATKALDAYDEAAAQASEAGEVLAEVDALIGVLSDLKLSLTDKAFPGWLAMRRSRGLLAAASRLFGEMTAGRYGFADHDEDWLVVDRDSGEARSPASLSGGEKFIASLALALAMVEMVKGSGGKLDALFLDEGFGALDRTNLDAAVQALEGVAASGRMVAVITHIAAVAEEVRDVLEVRASARGSQVRWLTDAERSETATADASSAVAGLIS